MTQPNRNTMPVLHADTEDALKSILFSGTSWEVKNAFQLYNLCVVAANTDMVPDKLKGKPAACFSAAMRGMPLGFDFITCIQRAYTYGLIPTFPVEMLLGVLRRRNDLCTHIKRGWGGEFGTDSFHAFIETRRGKGEIVRDEYSIAEAKQAGLIGKDNWKKDPKAMCMWRAVGRHLRMEWSDLMNGLQPQEEFQAIEDERGPDRARNVTPVRVVADAVGGTPAPASPSDPIFDCPDDPPTDVGAAGEAEPSAEVPPASPAIPDEDLLREAKLADLRAATDQRAERTGKSSRDIALRLLELVGAKVGDVLTLEQIERMLTACEAVED